MILYTLATLYPDIFGRILSQCNAIEAVTSLLLNRDDQESIFPKELIEPIVNGVDAIFHLWDQFDEWKSATTIETTVPEFKRESLQESITWISTAIDQLETENQKLGRTRSKAVLHALHTWIVDLSLELQ